MKKIIIAFLPLILLSIVGCDSEVDYTEITEEQFNAYYTNEKKAKAIDEIDSYTTFSVEYTSTQKNNNGSRYDYKQLTQIDKNYFYCEKHDIRGPVGDLKDETEYELVITTYPDESGSKYYHIIYDNILKTNVDQTLIEGEPAYDRYVYFENSLRANAKAFIENPIFARYDLSFYKGSNGTLVVISKSDELGHVYRYYIDSKTLFLKYYTFKDPTFSAKYIYRQNIKISHKTPKEIGFEG